MNGNRILPKYQMRTIEGGIYYTDNFLNALQRLQSHEIDKVSWDHEGGRLILRSSGQFDFWHPDTLRETLGV